MIPILLCSACSSFPRDRGEARATEDLLVVCSLGLSCTSGEDKNDAKEEVRREVVDTEDEGGGGATVVGACFCSFRLDRPFRVAAGVVEVVEEDIEEARCSASFAPLKNIYRIL